MAVDLHTHSLLSDGRLTPQEVVRKAARLKLKAVAVSDHDTLSGAIDALKYGKKYGIEVIPAVEISTLYKGHILHILGYFVDLRSRSLNNVLEKLRRDRTSRAMHILGRVNVLAKKRGMHPVDQQEFRRWIGNKDPIMRGDIAGFLFKKGFGKSAYEVFIEWLEETNSPVRGLSAKEAIAHIHKAGGVAVLAHPHHESLGLRAFTLKLSQHLKVIVSLARQGLDGCEVYVRKRRETERFVQYYLRVIKKLSLIPTGGSDFHGTSWSPELGSVFVPDSALAELKVRKSKYER